jgi:hypothetical protein
VADAVKAATGTSDADAAMAEIARDPQLAANLRVELTRIAAAAGVEAPATQIGMVETLKTVSVAVVSYGSAPAGAAQ